MVSTHSRLKAAGAEHLRYLNKQYVSTHSRLKAAGGGLMEWSNGGEVSTHSRLKAAGSPPRPEQIRQDSFNTQPPEGGWSPIFTVILPILGFNTQPPEGGWLCGYGIKPIRCRFNTQPPEGGWKPHLPLLTSLHMFQHTAA